MLGLTALAIGCTGLRDAYLSKAAGSGIQDEVRKELGSPEERSLEQNNGVGTKQWGQESFLAIGVPCGSFREAGVAKACRRFLHSFFKVACVVLSESYTFAIGGAMRTNIVIDNGLMRQAMKATGLSTKKAVVEEGLRLLIKVKGQEGVRRLRGKVRWEGDLNVMREGRIKAAS